MNSRPWSVGDKSALVAYARAGDSSFDIAEVLNRTSGAVKKMAGLLRVSLASDRHKIDPSKRAELLDRLAASPGATIPQLARALRRHPKSVLAMARRLAREGLLERTGGRTNSCRYVITRKWFACKPRV